MSIDRGLIGRIRARGEEVFTQLSAELMQNPGFMKAVDGALRGREKLEEAAAHALKQMNVPTRSELKRVNARLEALERGLAELRAEVKRGGRASAARTGAKKVPSRAVRPKTGAGS
jgi:hypothetical protein